MNRFRAALANSCGIVDRWDMLLLVGIALVAVALWWVHPSLSVGFVGVALIGVAVSAARVSARQQVVEQQRDDQE